MVFLLGRMGNNKQALMLIIERLGDVQKVCMSHRTNNCLLTVRKAIDFAKEQNDHDLWEDLLMYSENKPSELCPLAFPQFADFKQHSYAAYLRTLVPRSTQYA